ncbi:MAG: UDP-2,3-diacylglucosamine diphosphatase [Chitinophagaceae bacterium]
MHLAEGKKIYFASDFHLGAPDRQQSLDRERLVVRWLTEVQKDAAHIFLVGDLFDFWFEYKTVIPKGYTRLLGKLADLTDLGIGVSIFSGNHDMWMDGYFECELNIPVYHEPQTFLIRDKKFYIGHGDGLGPGDQGYKMLKRIFRNKICRWLFAGLHPNFGISFANYLSGKSRSQTGQEMEYFLGKEKEWLFIYSRDILQKGNHYDYFIFGHRHLPLFLPLDESPSYYVNLGDWLHYFSFGVFDGNQMELKYYPVEPSPPETPG